METEKERTKYQPVHCRWVTFDWWRCRGKCRV